MLHMTMLRHIAVEPGSVEVRQDPVLRAAYDCLLDVGMRRTTLTDVARRAGVSRMTVYRRYDDLSRLLSTLMTAEFEDLMDGVTREAAGLPHTRARVAAAITDGVAAISTHPLFRSVLRRDPDTLAPYVFERLGASQRSARDRLASVVAAGMSGRGGDGSVRDGDPGLCALTLLLLAQSWVFSAAIVEDEDPRALGELRIAVDSYLAPEAGPR